MNNDGATGTKQANDFLYSGLARPAKALGPRAEIDIAFIVAQAIFRKEPHDVRLFLVAQPVHEPTRDSRYKAIALAAILFQNAGTTVVGIAGIVGLVSVSFQPGPRARMILAARGSSCDPR